MNRDYIVDYCGYTVFRLIGPLLRLLPLRFSVFLGRITGSLFYCFDCRHKAIVYSHIRKAFGGEMAPRAMRAIAKGFYENIGQSFMEMFFIPLIDAEYMKKYIQVEGREHISEGFRRGKGVILLGVHAGSWELSNIISAILAFPFKLFVRDQRYPRLERLLNSYRRQKGCCLIQRQDQVRQLVETLKNNEAIGMTADQGGKKGMAVKFFGKDASMPFGAVRLALKYGSTLLPSFYTRINGPYIKTIITPPFEIKRSADPRRDIQDNLQEVVLLFEKYIRRYPKEYLWPYKAWKYSKEASVLILSDGKAGHLRQAQAAARILSDCLAARQIKAEIETAQVTFKNRMAKSLLGLSGCLAGKYSCQGCLVCLRKALAAENYNFLLRKKPDYVISCGSALAPVNFLLSRENLAKSVCVMRPGLLSAGKFNLVLMPRHDRPPKRRNIVVTDGALNLIDKVYLDNCISHIVGRISQGSDSRLAISDKQLFIGLLIGGDAKKFRLDVEMAREAVRQLKTAAEKFNAYILVTTSRRTSSEIEAMVKQELGDYRRCKLLVIANEQNIPEAVGGILGLSSIVAASPESISMISEAVTAKRQVLVFSEKGLDQKHARFLKLFSRKGYITLTDSRSLGRAIENAFSGRRQILALADNFLAREALSKII